MQTIYKVFLVLFIIFLGINLYAIDWNIGVMKSDNSKFLLSSSASIIGIVLVYVLHTWSKLSTKSEG